MAMLIMETMSWDVEFMATNKERDFGLLRELVNFLSCDQSASDRSNYDQNQGTNSADVDISDARTDECRLLVASVKEHEV